MNQKIIIAIAGILIVIAGAAYIMQTRYSSPYSPANTVQDQQANNNPASPAQGQIDVMVKNNVALGDIFTDGNGMTLYTYSKDTKDVSACYGGCAVNWPPLLVSASPKIGSNLIASKFGVTTRTDGGKQVTFEGMPLYYYIQDKKAGDTNGQGVGGVWSVYKVASDNLVPAGTAASPSSY
ncbi:MAG: hypothetical protein WC788_00300 [Candidatus Paceibacterota bacterium]|jgi:predicted lipoprotein with Yx(FWY)xxD motif